MTVNFKDRGCCRARLPLRTDLACLGGRRSTRDHARAAFLLQSKTRARVTMVINMLQNTLRPSASATAEHARADSYKVLETVLESIGA